MRLAIEVAQDGSLWAPRKVLARLLEASSVEASQEKSTDKVKFSARELEVLRLLVAGHPNRVIGEELGIDVTTVKKHVGRMMRKVGVDNRIALSMEAVKQKFLLKGSRTD